MNDVMVTYFYNCFMKYMHIASTKVGLIGPKPRVTFLTVFYNIRNGEGTWIGAPRSCCEHDRGQKVLEDVVEYLGITIHTVQNRWMKHKADEKLKNQPGRGRNSNVSKIAELVIAKSLTKKQYSTRKPSAKLTAKWYLVHTSTVH